MEFSHEVGLVYSLSKSLVYFWVVLEFGRIVILAKATLSACLVRQWVWENYSDIEYKSRWRHLLSIMEWINSNDIFIFF